MADERIAPVLQNKDALVKKGFLTPEFADILTNSAAPAAPVAPVAEELNMSVDPALAPPMPEFVPNQNGDIGPIAAIKARGTSAETVPTPAAPVSESANPISGETPVVAAAEQVVEADIAAKDQQQRIESDLRIKAAEEAQKRQLENQIADEKAIQSVATEETAKQQAKADQIQAEIDKEQEELKNFSIQDIVKNRSTGDSVLASIAIVLGGIGMGMSGSNTNQGLQAVNSKLDREFETQKLGMEQKLAAKRRVFDLIGLQLKQKAQQTDDALAKQKMQLMAAQLDQMQQGVLAQQMAEKQKRQLLAENKPIPASMLSPQQLEAVNKLRSEYNTQTQNLGSREILGSLNKIQNFTKNPSPAGDLGLIFEYMKVLDPKSTVREGEFALAAQTGSIPQQVVARYNKLIKGETLSAAQRDDFAKQAKTIAQAKLLQQRNVNKRYSDLSSQFEVPSSMVVENFDINSGEEPSSREMLIRDFMATGKSRADASSAIDNLVAKGKLNADKFKK